MQQHVYIDAIYSTLDIRIGLCHMLTVPKLNVKSIAIEVSKPQVRSRKAIA